MVGASTDENLLRCFLGGRQACFPAFFLTNTPAQRRHDSPRGRNARRFPAMESSLRLGSWHRWRGTYHRWLRSAVKYCSERHICSLSGKVIKRLVEMSSVCSSLRSPTSTTKKEALTYVNISIFINRTRQKNHLNQKQKPAVSCPVSLKIQFNQSILN